MCTLHNPQNLSISLHVKHLAEIHLLCPNSEVALPSYITGKSMNDLPIPLESAFHPKALTMALSIIWIYFIALNRFNVNLHGLNHWKDTYINHDLSLMVTMKIKLYTIVSKCSLIEPLALLYLILFHAVSSHVQPCHLVFALFLYLNILKNSNSEFGHACEGALLHGLKSGSYKKMITAIVLNIPASYQHTKTPMLHDLYDFYRIRYDMKNKQTNKHVIVKTWLWTCVTR